MIQAMTLDRLVVRGPSIRLRSVNWFQALWLIVPHRILVARWPGTFQRDHCSPQPAPDRVPADQPQAPLPKQAEAHQPDLSLLYHELGLLPGRFGVL